MKLVRKFIFRILENEDFEDEYVRSKSRLKANQKLNDIIQQYERNNSALTRKHASVKRKYKGLRRKFSEFSFR